MSSGPARAEQARPLRARVTAPPAPRPRWLRLGRFDLVFITDVLIAVIAFVLTNTRIVVWGEAEVATALGVDRWLFPESSARSIDSQVAHEPSDSWLTGRFSEPIVQAGGSYSRMISPSRASLASGSKNATFRVGFGRDEDRCAEALAGFEIDN